MSQGAGRKAVAWGLAATVAVVVLALAGWFWRGQQLAREEREKARQQIAREMQEKARQRIAHANRVRAKTLLGEAHLARQESALGYLARALLLDPESSAIRGLTANLLTRVRQARPGEPLHHDTAVDSASFSRDGRWVLTTTGAGELTWRPTRGGGARVWEAATGRLVHDLFSQNENVVFSRFSGDGLRVVRILTDGTAQVVDTATGQPMGEVLRHPTKIRWAVLSPDGQRVVTVAAGKAQIREAATGQPIGPPLQHEEVRPRPGMGVSGGGIVSARFSPDGRWLLTLAESRETRMVTPWVWHVATGELQSGPLYDGNQSVRFATFGPDGEYVVTASHQGVALVWEAATGRPVGERLRHRRDGPRVERPKRTTVSYQSGQGAHLLPDTSLDPRPDESQAEYSTQPLFAAALSPDGRRVVTASADHTARMFEVATGKQIGEPMKHFDAVLSASFSPDGIRVVTTSRDKSLRLWDAASGRPIGQPVEDADSVRSAVYSADGLRLVTSSRDGTVRVWPAGSGRPVGTPLRHRDQVRSASFSPDGGRVVTASRDGTAQTWDAATGERLGGPLAHDDEETPWSTASFSADGRWVLATAGKAVQVWETETGEAVGAPMKHLDAVEFASFSPDDRWVLTVTHNGRIELWEAATGRQLSSRWSMSLSGFANSASFSADGRWIVATLEVGEVGQIQQARIFDLATHKQVGRVRSLVNAGRFGSFSPYGRRVAVLAGNTVQLLETTTDRAIGEPIRHLQDVHTASFSADGRWLVTASEDRTARMWEAATGQALGEPMRHGDGVTQASFSADGQLVLTVAKDAAVRVWETASSRPLGEPMRHGAAVRSASFSADGSRIVTVSGNRARVWEAATGRPVGQPMRSGFLINTASFSADGRRVVTAARDATAQVWDAATGQPVGARLGQPEFDGVINSASLSPDGRWLVTTSASSTDADKAGTARVWEAATGEPAGEPLRHVRGVGSAVFSPDGMRLVTTTERKSRHSPFHFPGSSGAARVWDRVTAEPVGEPMPDSDSASFSPDGRWLVTAGGSGVARVRDVTTGQSVGEPMRHEGSVRSASFSPDGEWIVTASGDGTARVWEAATGEPVGEPIRHEGAVSSASFSPDGERIVTASADGTARVWNARTGQAVGQPMRPARAAGGQQPPAPLATASFSPDGQLVVTASRGKAGAARVWEAATGRLVSSYLQHHDDVVAASFHPRGRQVVTASSDGSARVWDVDLPACSRAGLELVATLAEVMGGYRLDEDDNLEMLAPEARSSRLEELRARVAPAGDGESDCVAFVRWHLTHPHERTISPFSEMTVDEYLLSLAGVDREDARWEAAGFHNHPLLAAALDRDDESAEP